MLLFDTGKKLEKAFTQEQFDALVEVLERREDRAATKEDLRETELRDKEKTSGRKAEPAKETEKIRSELKTDIEKIRAETERVRLEVRETEARLKADNEKVKYDLLKWQIGGWIALATIMAKGFGWLGF